MGGGMGMGSGPGQGPWPSQPQPSQPLPQQPGQPQGQFGGRQYPAPGYPGQPQPQPQPHQQPYQPGPAGPGRYSSGGRFPVAEPFDGVNPDGSPRIMRAQLDPREIPALQMYLTQAPVVLAAPGNAQDELVPSAGQNIPRAFHSDGVWVWPAAVGYYLGYYQLPPSDALLAHIRMRNYQLGFVDQETRSAAATELMAILNAPAPPPQVPSPAPAPAPTPPAPMPAGPAPAAAQSSLGSQGMVIQGSVVQGPAGRQPAPSPSLPSPTPALAPVPATLIAAVAEPDASLSSSPTLLSASASSSSSALSQSDLTAADSAASAEPRIPAGPTMVFSAAEALAQWASLDSSLPQAAPPLAPARFSPEFAAAGNKHAAWVSEQLEAFTAYMPTGEWSVDHETRRYTQSDRSFIVDGLGTLSPEGVWTWAWSNFGGWDQDSGILDQSRVLRSLAERQGIAELASGSLDLAGVGDAEDPETAAEMLAWTAMGLLSARGYIGHGSKNGGRIYYLVTDPTVPAAAPTIGLIAKHLFEGAATFGEDATECVIGYAEHHSWEWNRTPNGIGVAALGVGSFAVEVADNRLVGISLHV